jgi:hypothetical protein
VVLRLLEVFVKHSEVFGLIPAAVVPMIAEVPDKSEFTELLLLMAHRRLAWKNRTSKLNSGDRENFY